MDLMLTIGALLSRLGGDVTITQDDLDALEGSTVCASPGEGETRLELMSARRDT